MKFVQMSLLCLLMSVSGCQRSSEINRPAGIRLQTYFDVFGTPHILQENACYYFSPWHPGAYVLKIHFEGDTILEYESRMIDESDLHYYIPLLIEKLNIDEHNDAIQSLIYLRTIMHMMYPHGYYEAYYLHPTENIYTGTPFADRQATWDRTTYRKWKDWYARDGAADFLRMQNESPKDKLFY